jgi:tripartite-type tricarboxylate transporter receptor subunit TctC
VASMIRLGDRLASVGCAIVLLAAVSIAQAQPYPSKPIRLIVPYAPGGSGDMVARTVGAKLTEVWGQQVLVDNRPGAAGIMGAGQVAHALADGYTLLVGTDAQMAISPHIQKSLPYDPDKDFAHIVQAAFIEFILTTHPSMPGHTLGELVAHLKANPGKYSYASPGIGSSAHLSMEWFKSVAGVEIVHVPYKGSGQILLDTISGVVQIAYTGIPQTMPHAAAGRLKAIAIGSAKRLSAAPGVPTMAETYPGFEANASWNFAAPAGTPRDIILKLNNEINRILLLPDVGERLSAQGLIPIGGTPEQFALRMKSDYQKWGNVIRRIGMTAN